MSGCRVRVCSDCCCGTTCKHPGVDHAALVRRLVAAVGDRAEVTITSCLLACEDSNVVVVSPGAPGRAVGARPVWLRRVLDESTVDAISAWVAAGGPGLAPPPQGLRLRRSDGPPLGDFVVGESASG